MIKHCDFNDIPGNGFQLLDFDPVLNPDNFTLFDDCEEYSWDEMSEIITTLCKAGYDIKTSYAVPQNDYKHFYLDISKGKEHITYLDFQIIDEDFMSDFAYDVEED